MSYNRNQNESEVIVYSVMAVIISILMIVCLFSLASCTLSVTLSNVSTKGIASDVGDEALSSSSDLDATVPIVP